MIILIFHLAFPLKKLCQLNIPFVFQYVFRMVLENTPWLSGLVTRLGSSPGVGSVAASPFTTIPARIRAALETILVRHLYFKLKSDLIERSLFENFSKVCYFKILQKMASIIQKYDLLVEH